MENLESKTVEVSFQLISIAGDAKATALMALQTAKNGNYAQAKEELDEARKKLVEVHQIHADILASEANGEKMDLSTLFIHSQDHLTSAIVIIDLAEHIINLYQK